MMSSAGTSSPVLRLIWLKLTFSVSDVAGYRATGQVTSERRKKPFQLARGAMGYSKNAPDEGPSIPLENRVSSNRGGESHNAVNRGRGRGSAAARLRRPDRSPAGPQNPGTSSGIMRFLTDG